MSDAPTARSARFYWEIFFWIVGGAAVLAWLGALGYVIVTGGP